MCGSGEAARDLVSLLLEPVVPDRLGCGPDGVSLLKEHAWFAVDGHIDWQALLAKRVRAPIVPPALITSNFAKYDSSDDEGCVMAGLPAVPGQAGDEWCAGF